MENYLIINTSLNVVTNIVVWDGNTNVWSPPVGSIALPKATMPTKIWELNAEATDFVLTDSINNTAVGFTYDGSVCITNEPKPEAPPQPVTQGTQTL